MCLSGMRQSELSAQNTPPVRTKPRANLKYQFIAGNIFESIALQT